MNLPVSTLAPAQLIAPSPIAGVRLFTGETGAKYTERLDLFGAIFAKGTVCAGSFTQNQIVGAPVVWTRARFAERSPAAIIVNAGNANVATGERGDAAVRTIAEGLSKALGCSADEILQASTGVIGQDLDPAPIVTQALKGLAREPARMLDAAKACLTTDTFAKTAEGQGQAAAGTYRLSGFAKGSGMVHPDMATMLAFVFTDAKIDRGQLQSLHQAAVAKSFNAISVDGDTSTSDMALVFATGQGPELAPDDLAEFGAALTQLYQDLAQQIVRDGEGASKFVAIEVSGAASDSDAKALGLSLATSPLVKTMIAGEDANWGRLLMALGKTAVPIAPDQIAVQIGGIPIAAAGCALADYDETPVATHMTGKDIDIAVSVGTGPGQARVWTCDLTHGYISINADYRS